MMRSKYNTRKARIRTEVRQLSSPGLDEKTFIFLIHVGVQSEEGDLNVPVKPRVGRVTKQQQIQIS